MQLSEEVQQYLSGDGRDGITQPVAHYLLEPPVEGSIDPQRFEAVLNKYLESRQSLIKKHFNKQVLSFYLDNKAHLPKYFIGAVLGEFSSHRPPTLRFKLSHGTSIVVTSETTLAAQEEVSDIVLMNDHLS